MKLKLVFFIGIILSFFSCENEENNINDKIHYLQQKAIKSTDSSFYYLSKSKVLINSSKTLPDSLKAENNLYHIKYCFLCL